MRHYEKVDSNNFNEILHKRKNFLVVEESKEYSIGDIIVLDEFNNFGKATGKALTRSVIYIDADNEDAINKGYCIIGLEL